MVMTYRILHILLYAQFQNTSTFSKQNLVYSLFSLSPSEAKVIANKHPPLNFVTGQVQIGNLVDLSLYITTSSSYNNLALGRSWLSTLLKLMSPCKSLPADENEIYILFLGRGITKSLKEDLVAKSSGDLVIICDWFEIKTLSPGSDGKMLLLEYQHHKI